MDYVLIMSQTRSIDINFKSRVPSKTLELNKGSIDGVKWRKLRAMGRPRVTTQMVGV